MAELLLELLSEEIPARMQARAAEDLKRLVTEKLKAAGLAFDEARAYATPRRLALVVEGLPEKQPDITEEKKGPKVGAPEQAAQGFMKANGLASIDEAEVRETPKGDFYFAVREVKGRPTAELIPAALADVVTSLTWPKSMRWPGSSMRWVRPMHRAVCLFDGEAIGSELPAEVIESTQLTLGHRFLAPKPFEVSSFADYETKLRKAMVILDPAERRAIIAERAAKLAKKAGLTVKDDPALLDEVAGLVEWPEVLMGRIDKDFMDLPPEVLTTAMRHHQKYFSTLDKKGGLADRFLVVANMAAPEGSVLRDTITAGNERVLRARLADARFFWDQDCKQMLAERVPALSEIVFHAKLGTLAEKVSRMQTLAVEIAGHIPGAERDRVRSAARLAKADLVTGMVGEFPELQGVMGRYYARHDGEHAEVAEAIADHYAPQGPADRCPSAPISVAVALADKIDTLAGMFAIGETPTGSKDPYALRRAALGVIRLVVENRLRLPLFRVLSASADLFEPVLGRALVAEIARAGVEVAGGKKGSARVDVPKSQDETRQQLLAFFADRLKVALRDKGVRHDLISAVFALGGEDDLVRLLDRVEALEDFLGSDDGANLLVAYRRAANIVRIESKKDKRAYDGAADAGRFREDEETALFGALDSSAEAAGDALAKEDFTGAMSAMAGLRQPVDAFFDRVTVNAEDPALRENRLNLLARIGATLGNVADFSKIEG